MAAVLKQGILCILDTDWSVFGDAIQLDRWLNMKQTAADAPGGFLMGDGRVRVYAFDQDDGYWRRCWMRSRDTEASKQDSK